jgi:hypothetical protein
MDKYNNIKNYKPERFRAITGIYPATFEAMLEVINKEYAEVRRKGGRERKLTCENMLLMTLEYYKEYRTYECIGASYDLHKTNVGDVIKWVENTLITSGLFSLPGKRRLADADAGIDVIVVDTTETPIQRPRNPKKQREYYSGKKNDTP